MESNYNTKFIRSEKYTKILDGLFEILHEINHVIIVNTNEIFLDDVLNKLKKDPLIIDTIKLLKLVKFDLSKISYSNEFFDEIEKHNKKISFAKNQNENSFKINTSNNFNNYENNIKNNNDEEYLDAKSNKYCLLAKKLQKILNEIQLISNNYSEKAREMVEKEALAKEGEKKVKFPKIHKSEIEKKQRMKIKKSYEVDVLSRYMIDIFRENRIKNVIEMGCGKSYLTNNILINEDMVYFGIDKKEHLIVKSEHKAKKNIFLINEIVDFENFDAIYQNQIKENLIASVSKEKKENKNLNENEIQKDIFVNNNNINQNLNTPLKNSFFNKEANSINNKIEIEKNINSYQINNFSNNINKIENEYNKTQNKIMLFGLHSCGNLTSDSIKVFVKNSVLTHLVIVGCCLNLLVEYVSPEAKSSQFFKDYIASIGCDNKGTFLENTLLYDFDFRKIGYPLSEFIKTQHKSVFLGRPLRNIAMQNIPKPEHYIMNADKNFKYKNLFFRALLQKYFENYLFDLKSIYGYGKLQLSLQDSFSLYIKNSLLRIEKMIDENDLKIKDVDNNLLKSKLVLLRQKIKYIPEENKSNFGSENEKNNTFVESKNIYNVNNVDKAFILDGEIEEKNKIDMESFYEKFLVYENILWSFYAIRVKFAKIIEYIIALDRIIFLKENNFENVELVKIFDDNKSARNLLIYATKLE
jgi:hypothetical protein